MPRGDYLKNHPEHAKKLAEISRERMKNLTPEQRAEMDRKRMERKKLREDLEFLLTKAMRGTRVDFIPDSTSIEKIARRNGLNVSAQQCMLVALVNKAANGDIEAIKLIRDTMGEKQVEKLEVGVSYEDYVKNHKVKF